MRRRLTLGLVVLVEDEGGWSERVRRLGGGLGESFFGDVEGDSEKDGEEVEESDIAMGCSFKIIGEGFTRERVKKVVIDCCFRLFTGFGLIPLCLVRGQS